MRLQKFLSHSGICSRRKAEEYIAAGLVKVNGIIAHIGQVIDPEKDQITFGDQIAEDQKKLVYYAFHKPRGVVTTCLSGTEKAPGILDIVDFPERVFPVGRLDKDTTGLILMTNDGRISNYLMQPKFSHEKEYLVEVYGKIEDSALTKMQKGILIELKIKNAQTELVRMYKTKPCKIARRSSSKFSIVLGEGKNRQIRKMVSAVGHDVKRLKRIRIENIELGDLAEGSYRLISQKEIKTLLATLSL